MTHPYDADYYLNGVASKKSNYVDYHWMEERTMAFAVALMAHLDIEPGDTLMDYGTARGYTVKALRRLGVSAFGYDISQWAIENCDPEVAQHVSNKPEILTRAYDFTLAKDVFEHLEVSELRPIVDHLLTNTRSSMLAIVPLAFMENTDYVRKEDNQDATHVIRWPLQSWLDFFQNRAGERFTASASWHLNGLKPTSFTHLKSCGFIRLDRVT